MRTWFIRVFIILGHFGGLTIADSAWAAALADHVTGSVVSHVDPSLLQRKSEPALGLLAVDTDGGDALLSNLTIP